MKRTIPRMAFLALSSLLLFSPVAANASTISMVGSQWTVSNLIGTQVQTSHATTVPNGIEFPFPDASATPPGYTLDLLDSYRAGLSTSDTLTAKINVVTSTLATAFEGNPSGGCPTSSPSLCPGAVRLFFESNLPQAASVFPNSCTGANANEYSFWWSNTPIAATLATPGSYYQFAAGGSNGPITLQVQLDPKNWSDECGTFGNQSYATTQEFLAAISKIQYIGLSFGSGYFFANGVGVDGTTGTATFQLEGYGT